MIDAALAQLDLSALLGAYLEQADKHGHTIESDRARPLDDFAPLLGRLAAELRDVMVRGDRRNLAVAYRRAARVGALALAVMARIRHEQEGAPDSEA